MEVCHQHIHDTESESGNYDYPCSGLQFFQSVVFEITDDGIQGFFGRISVIPDIWIPLSDISRSPFLNAVYTYII